MNRFSTWIGRLSGWAVVASLLLAVGTSCDEMLEDIAETESAVSSDGNDTRPPPPPPPSRRRTPAVADPPPTEPDPQTPEPDEPEESPPEEPPDEDRFIAIPDRALTPEEAREAIEAAGGRVAVDDSDNVVSVFLNRTDAGDDVLRAVKYLPTVKVVNLTGTRVTDEGLEHLWDLPELERIYPAWTDVTEAGLDDLQTALPELQILE